MNQSQDRIAQFQKMASDDPDNELGHFRLGQLYMEASQFEDAVTSLRRTLELSPQFSKVYQLLGNSLIKLNKKEEAIEVLQKGFHIADERGDKIPRDDMAKLLVELGETAPTPTSPAGSSGMAESGFRCARPNCPAGKYARQLTSPPFKDELGQKIYERVCQDCWSFWLRDMSIKVINEMRLDLSTERGQEIYDQMMRESLGLDT